MNPLPASGSPLKPQTTGADGLPKGREEGMLSRDDPPRGGYGKMQIET
ncbi:MAG: hypothetical protein J7L75_05065 [Thermoproteales archaeon]|nr:hypothetical protein [Thermoproteales archaeon]